MVARETNFGAVVFFNENFNESVDFVAWRWTNVQLNNVFLLLCVMQNVFIDLFYDVILLWNELFSCDRCLKMIVFLDDVFFVFWFDVWTYKIVSQ